MVNRATFGEQQLSDNPGFAENVVGEVGGKTSGVVGVKRTRPALAITSWARRALEEGSLFPRSYKGVGGVYAGSNPSIIVRVTPRRIERRSLKRRWCWTFDVKGI